MVHKPVPRSQDECPCGGRYLQNMEVMTRMKCETCGKVPPPFRD